MSAILDYILRTNFFNFILFAGIILFLFKKLDVSGNLEKAKDSVKDSIEASETAKTASENKLADIEAAVANIEKEIENIISKSVENANTVGKQIIEDGNQMAENIYENSEKIVENKTSLLKNDILNKASKASVELAKSRIIEELNSNADLHIKLIDESVDSVCNMEVI